ncbi:MAG TPA: VCBS repeat-containing protein, partial [Verrucomicrobiae bacterium]
MTDRVTATIALLLLAASTLAAESHVHARPVNIPAAGKIGFEQMNPAETGILFTNFLSDPRSVVGRNLLSGSGVACGDIDGDGLCDIYFCGLDSENKLFRNLGNWKFQDITASAGSIIACVGQDSMGAAFADVDGDGDLDLLVNALGNGTRLFLNDGKGHFSEATDAAGLRSKAGSMSLALADLNGDGYLDLYVANFRPTTIKDNPHTTISVQMVDGQPFVSAVDGRSATAPDLTNRFSVAPSGAILEFGEADDVYLNDGHGHFRRLSWTDGTFLDEYGKPLREPPRDWSLAVQIRDLNGDGIPDIYVCSDLFTPDRVWINDGHAKFRALDNFALRSTPTFSMGVDFADIDRDGHLDWFMVDMFARDRIRQNTQLTARNTLFPIGMIDIRPQLLRNTLHWNRGDNTFAEIAWYAGVEASDWSWGPIFLDVDLDGYED